VKIYSFNLLDHYFEPYFLHAVKRDTEQTYPIQVLWLKHTWCN